MALKPIKVTTRLLATKARRNRRPYVVTTDPPKGLFRVIGLYVDDAGKLVVEFDDEPQ